MFDESPAYTVDQDYELDIEDYILAILWYGRGRRLSKLHIMKILASFARLTGREEFFDFAPYRMGLYSPEVSQVIDEMKWQDIIVHRGKGYELSRGWEREAASAAGKLEELHPDEAELLKRLTTSLSRLRRDELLLLHYVVLCDEYCRRVSDEWRKIERFRKEIAVRMVREGKISWRLAARLAGMSPEEFAEYAEKQGVRVGDRLYRDDVKAALQDSNHLRFRLKHSSNC